MRYTLKNARESQHLKPVELAEILKITERMYRYMEAGGRTGKSNLWDSLEEYFGIPQRQLRENTPEAKLTVLL